MNTQPQTATPGPVPDRVIGSMIASTMAAQHGRELTKAEAESMIYLLPSVLRELLALRMLNNCSVRHGDAPNVVDLNRAQARLALHQVKTDLDGADLPDSAA